MEIDDHYSTADDNGKQLLQHARKFIGKYVRMALAPKTRMGTIEDAHLDHGRVEYLFHHDQRFNDKLPKFYIYEDDFEICERPSDEYVRTVNVLIRYAKT
jgi:hypothetical protein